jgi:hypothetical protein
MNVQYLWIDALCIIQNDIEEQDWYVESGNMRHIYSNSLFTIAADLSTNRTDGLFLKRPIHPTWRSFRETDKRTRHPGMLFRKSFAHRDESALLSSALSKRGWALQESILPTRILHFTAEEMVWECNTHCRCECGLPGYSLVKLTCQGISRTRTLTPKYTYDSNEEASRDIVNFLSKRTPESVYWSWQTIVEYYTKRKLTNDADKLSALSGLAQVAIDSHGFGRDAYLAGLWRGGLVKSLLWHVKGPLEPRRYTEYRAPSWSWASIDSSVKYFAEHYQFQFFENVTIIEAKCDASPLDPTGRVNGGHILLSGSLARVRVSIKHGYQSIYTGYNGHATHTHEDQIANVQRFGHERMFEVLLDERMAYGDFDSDYYCLQTGTNFDAHTQGARVWWLVLKKRVPVPESETCVFERVGIGYKYTPARAPASVPILDLFTLARKETIMLV